MTWNKSDLLLKRRLAHHGIGEMVEAGILCQEAERLLPDLFRAVSVKDQVLHLEIRKENILALKMQEGRLLQDLNTYANLKKLPNLSRIRLTFGQV